MEKRETPQDLTFSPYYILYMRNNSMSLTLNTNVSETLFR